MTTPFVVLADDLTGAAEIAALGARCGRRAVVVTAGRTTFAPADFVVVDTDTRLCEPVEAARRVGAIAADAPIARAPWVFKKTDSVLRGPIAAELAAIASVRRIRRVLLVPANPALGRVVCHGQYLVNGQPLHLTSFARDPHHPAHSDRVVDLLGDDAPLPVFSSTWTNDLPDSGLVVGDAENESDLAAWAERVDANTLPAGAAGFCRALLRHAGWIEARTLPPCPRRGPVLILSGTIFPASLPQESKRLPPRVDIPVNALSDPAAQRSWENNVAQTLAQDQTAHVATVAVPAAAGVSSQLQEFMNALTSSLHHKRAFAHLVVEGGATASALVRHLGWSELVVVHEWAQGIVTLRPEPDEGVDITIKPGSYAWPSAWGKLWFGA